MKKQIISMKRGAQKGFTLIELMVVVAIIAILAAFALPMFQDYTKRTRVAEGLAIADGLKTQIVEAYASNSAWPSSNADAGLAASSKLNGSAVSGIKVTSSTVGMGGNAVPSGVGTAVGSITITYTNKIDATANKIVLMAYDTGTAAVAGSGGTAGTAAASGVMRWICRPAASPNGVSARFLPPECK